MTQIKRIEIPYSTWNFEAMISQGIIDEMAGYVDKDWHNPFTED